MPKFGLNRTLTSFIGPFRAPMNRKPYVFTKRTGKRFLRGAEGTSRYHSGLATKIQKLWRGRHSRLKNPIALMKKYRKHPLLGSSRLKYGGGYGVNSFRYQR